GTFISNRQECNITRDLWLTGLIAALIILRGLAALNATIPSLCCLIIRAVTLHRAYLPITHQHRGSIALCRKKFHKHSLKARRGISTPAGPLHLAAPSPALKPKKYIPFGSCE